MCKSLVVTQVEVSFRAVICDKDLAMLKGRHRARVNVDVRIELDQRDVESASFKQAANRRRCQAFSQTGNHAAGNKDIFSHCCLPSTFYLLPSTFSAHCSLLTASCSCSLPSAPASSPFPLACFLSWRPSLKSSCASTAFAVAGSRIFCRPTKPALSKLGASAARFSNSSTLTS